MKDSLYQLRDLTVKPLCLLCLDLKEIISCLIQEITNQVSTWLLAEVKKSSCDPYSRGLMQGLYGHGKVTEFHVRNSIKRP